MENEIRNLIRLMLQEKKFKPAYSEKIDYKKNPEEYSVSKGVSGVFSVSPYKDQIIKHFTFKNIEQSKASAEKIYNMFEEYRDKKDFVGMDMARKFLELGYLQSLRFSKFSGGKKYTKSGNLKRSSYKEKEKLEISNVYKSYLDKANSDKVYKSLKRNML